MKKENCDYCGKEGVHEYRTDEPENATLTSVAGGTICGECYQEGKHDQLINQND